MKKTMMISLLISAVVTFIIFSNVNAQRLNVYGSVTDIITVDNLSTRVSNLFIIDSIKVDHQAGETRLPTNEVIHQASFEIELGAGTVNILGMLLSGIQGKQLPSLMLSRVNYQNQVMEERNFSMVTVKEIVFPELNSAEVKDVARAKIIIQASDVLYNDNPGGKVGAANIKNSKSALGSNFRLAMGTLPTERVLRISKLRLVSSSKPEYMYFSLDVATTDAKRWNEWFRTGAGTGTKEDAMISLLDQTAANILSLQLSEVEIVSISVSSAEVTSKTGSIPKITIGLRTINPPIIQ